MGYAFVHMERKEEALAAIDALNGTMFKGRQLAVELSKAQPLVNQMGSGGNSTGAEEFEAEILCSTFAFYQHSLMFLLPSPRRRWASTKAPAVH